MVKINKNIFFNFQQNILILFIVWYFFETPKKILKAWDNVLSFNLEYFSIIPLLKTLFSPWRRSHFSYGPGFDIKEFFGNFAFNFMSRIIGMIIRTILIIIGLLVELFIILIGSIILLSWLILPLLLFYGVSLGIKLL